MRIRDWHPGQLGVYWIGTLIACFIVYGIAWILAAGNNEALAGFVVTLGIFGLLLVALIVTWRWFGARNKPPGSD